MTPYAATIGQKRTPGADASEQAPPVQPDFLYYDDLVKIGWPSIARGIILAGGAYPLVVGTFFAYVLIAAFLFAPRFGPPEPDVGFVAEVPAMAMMAGLVGLIWASVVTVFTLPVIHLFIWTLKQRPNLLWLGAFSGGLVAFFAVLPVTIHIPTLIHTGEAWGATIVFLVGPGVATVVGQVSGAMGGRRAMWRLVRDDKMTAQTGHPRFRFRSIHLLWLGVWLSLLLTVIRLSGIPFELILPLLAGWLAYQTATLATGGWMVRRLGPWWTAKRQTRST